MTIVFAVLVITDLMMIFGNAMPKAAQSDSVRYLFAQPGRTQWRGPLGQLHKYSQLGRGNRATSKHRIAFRV